MIHSVNVALEIARIAFKKLVISLLSFMFGNYIKSTSYHFVKPALSKGLLAQAYNTLQESWSICYDIRNVIDKP